jgi:hypothetical protein
MALTGAEPDPFANAVATLSAVQTRPEILLEEVPAPQRLAPRSHALSGTVLRGDEEVATGRLIVLHDPSGQEAWAGHWRVVSYVTAELEAEMGTDPLLAAVGWSWLLDALDLAGAKYGAIGGTVTQVSSTRFGDLAGPPTSSDVEVRASWTPLLDDAVDLAPHLDAWCGLLASTAGLPPPGVTVLAAHNSA